MTIGIMQGRLVPPLGGLVIFLLVFGFFNSQWISGQVAYRLKQRNHTLVNKVVTVTKSNPVVAPIRIDKNAAPNINIPKISVGAPVIYSQTVVDQKAFQQALHDGVVHYPATALPGQAGNIVIFGHSSDQWWAPGHYKFVFSLLDKLEKKDQITLDYDGIRYVYEVTEKYVVLPDNTEVLSPSAKHKLTLITCTPVGSNKKRLIIEATQISPSVDAPATTPKETITTKEKLPGGAPSFWQSLTDLF